ncbi:MAG: MFS transporter [Candidatus Hydrothermarchaeaceae archaeon]
MQGDKLITKDYILTSLFSFTTFTSFYFLLATLPLYILTIGGSESEIGLIIGIFTISAVIFRLFLGREADVRGKKKILVLSSLMFLIAMFIYSLTSSVAELLALRLFHGVAWAGVTTSAGAIIADLVPEKRRGEGMGYYGMFANLAMGFGPALGMAIANIYGFNSMFFSASAIAVLALLISLSIKGSYKSGRIKSAEASMLSRGALFPSTVMLLVTMTYGSIVSFLPLHARSVGIENPGIFFTPYAVVLLITRPIAGKLSDKYGRRLVIIPGIILMGLGMLALSYTLTLSILLLVALLYGMGFGSVQPTLMALTVDRVRPERRGAAMGTFSSAFDLGIAIGSIFLGVVLQVTSFKIMYICAAFASLIGLFVFLIGRKG